MLNTNLFMTYLLPELDECDDELLECEELELCDGVYPEFNVADYLKGEVAPVFFGSALNNFGVRELLHCFLKIAPQPQPSKAETRIVMPEEEKFTG